VTVLTPRGAGGVAVVEVTGADRHSVVGSLLVVPGSGRPVDWPPVVAPRLLSLRIGGEEIDRVLVIDRPNRGTIELHSHGAEAVLRAIEDALGARPSELDPVEQLLSWSMGDGQLRLALEQRPRDWPGFLTSLRVGSPNRSRAVVAAALRRSRVSVALAQPAKLVLCGAQNAGKSTLMNRLLFHQRVLTGATAGLTRDPVQELVLLDGYPYLLIDTAGEGEVTDPIDHRALRRARAARRRAYRLVVVDGSRGPGSLERRLCDGRSLRVCTKGDLPQVEWPAGFHWDVRVSCADPAGAHGIRQLIGEMLRLRRGLPHAGPVGGPAALSAAEFDELRAVARWLGEGL
jgi:tRNA modification GTPase